MIMLRALLQLLARRIAENLPAIVTCVVLVIVTAQYIRHASLAIPTGGTQLGRVYGWIGLALIVFLASYSLRKRWQVLWPGSLEAWLRWHTFLGILALGLIFLHSGFRTGGIFEAGSLIMLTATVISGILGLFVFVLIPPLFSALDTRTRVPDLPEEIATTMAEIRQIGESCSEPARAFVERDLLERLAHSRVSWRKPELRASEELLRDVVSSLSGERTEVINRLRELAADVMEKRRQAALHWHVKLIEAAGLHIHVALTTALLFLVAAHLFTVWYY